MVEEQKEILRKYNEVSDRKLDINDFQIIYPQIKLITSYLPFDDVEIIELIDILLEFKDNNQLEIINNQSLSLLSRAIGNMEGFYNEDRKYFCLRMKHLLMPRRLNKCPSEKEEEIVSYLAEFDIMINNIVTEFKDKDYLLLQKYNEELCQIALECKKVVSDYQAMNENNTEYISDAMIIDITFSHLATMLYFQIGEYQYDYSLYSKVAHKILENYQEYLFLCRIYHIFEDNSPNIFNPTNVYNEYLLCRHLLDEEFNSFRLVRKRD